MNALGNKISPQLPRDGMITRFVKNVFLSKGYVSNTEKLGKHFQRISLKGDELKKSSWRPGDKIQINMGIGFNNRTYTPISWDVESGETSILVYFHGEGPGCQWAMRAQPQQPVEFLGPRESLDLTSVAANAALFGDETSFALAAALRNTLGGKSAVCVFEVADRTEARAVLGEIGVPDALVVERAPDDSHLGAVHDALLRQVTPNTQFVLSGKAASIQSVKKALAVAGIRNTHQKAKAYWAPGKVGLD